jgi:anti-sigma factor RsiW
MTIKHPSDVVLAAFAAGTLDQGQRIAIATHVSGCASCHAFVRAMEHVGGIVLDGLPPTSLAGGSLAEVMARLDKETNGGQAARVEARKRQAEPALPSVGAPVHWRTRANPPWHNWALQAAAAMLLLTLGATGGWFAKEYSASAIGPETARTSLVARALDAHVVYAADQRHPIEVVASERDHLNAWLSRRIQHQIAAPDLENAGYFLLGGRLLSDRGKPAALFMYQDAAGNRLTVFVAQTDEPLDRGSKHIVRDDLRAISWSDGPLTLAVTGTLDSDRLRGIGEIVRTSVKG